MYSVENVAAISNIESTQGIFSQIFTSIKDGLDSIPTILIILIIIVLFALIFLFIKNKIGHWLDSILMWSGILFIAFIIPLLIIEVFLSLDVELPTFITPLVNFYAMVFRYLFE